MFFSFFKLFFFLFRKNILRKFKQLRKIESKRNNTQGISELGDPVCVIWNFQEVGGKTLLPIKGAESEV